ncbi:CRISPR-associated helicase Cas3' [Nocardia takedensis]
MTELDRVWAKSPRAGATRGEPLTEHLAASLAGAIMLEQRVGRIGVVPDAFWSWVKVAALTHDAGKVPAGFQAMLAGPGGPRWGQRHEVYSLGFVADLLSRWPHPDRDWVAVGVLTHHRPLTGEAGRAILSTYRDRDPAAFAARFGPVEQAARQQLWVWLATTLREQGLVQQLPETSGDLAAAGFELLEQIRRRWFWAEEISPEDNLTAVLVQGAVTFADHVSSAHGQLLLEQPLDSDFAARFTTEMSDAGRPLRPHQHRAAALDAHLMLRTPTGSGKTEAALLWAARQVTRLRAQCGGQPRVFYLLPYLASINAMVARVASMLDQDVVGVVHSKAAAFHLHRSLCDSEQTDPAGRAVSRAAATRLFREPIRIGTPYQLLRGALAGTACSSILIDAANSVFILDELHSYEPQRLGMILASLTFWVRLGGRVGVVTATIPDQLIDLLDQCLDGDGGFTQIRTDATQWPRRHRLRIGTEHLTDDTTLTQIETRLRAGQSVLVVANNVADALLIAEQLTAVCMAVSGDEPIVLHSRFRTMDRAAIETRVRDRYGTGRPHRPGLVVATQVVEVSLDVSFDALHTSGAPLEPLIQRFGRINRIAAGPPADVVVHPPRFRQRPGSADEWADGVYEREPTEHTMTILTRHHDTALDEQLLTSWLNDIYATPWGDRWLDTVNAHKESFARLLQFEGVFDGDRDQLGEQFEDMFDGVEAILAEDVNDYTEALASVTDRRAGRLLGSQYLIPLPQYARRFARYDRGLDILVINGIYDPNTGLTSLDHTPAEAYRLGEVV